MENVVKPEQISMTEWFARMGHPDAEALRVEDNTKRDRLEVLYQTIGLPYDRPERFEAAEYLAGGPRVEALLRERGDEGCAFRLVPKKPGLEKLRNRGLTIRAADAWLRSLSGINFSDYALEIIPHFGASAWSAIFVVKENQIFGEVVAGLPHQLTQGDTVNEPIQFSGTNVDDLQWSSIAPGAIEHIREALRMLTSDGRVLPGYFETFTGPHGVTFTDYNRLLPKYLSPGRIRPEPAGEAVLHGAIAMPGRTHGSVRIISEDAIESADFPVGAILVCDNTSPRYLPLMRKAAAIITNRGGILSHAAIVSRELGIPCIIGTKTATKVLKDGDGVEVDANFGFVKRFE